MKSWTWAIILVATVAIIVGIEEWRISGLQGQIAKLSTEKTEGAPARDSARNMPTGGDVAARPTRSGRSSDATDGDRTAANSPKEGGEESFGKTLRKMVDNPATKAMMNQGIKAMAGVWFGDLIKDLDLTEEEKDYFLNLVGGGFSEQQAIGMKMMDVKDPEERKAIMDELETAKEERKKAIEEFLNDDEDYQAYKDYEDRLPERQQIDGLRAVMSEAGKALSPEQEDQVMEAMYRARKDQTNRVDWEGAGGMEAMAGGNAVELFERDWEANSKNTIKEVSTVLDGEQLDAFGNYLGQVKEMQLMGIKMAEKMFSNDGGGDQPPPAPAPVPEPAPEP